MPACSLAGCCWPAAGNVRFFQLFLFFQLFQFFLFSRFCLRTAVFRTRALPPVSISAANAASRPGVLTAAQRCDHGSVVCSAIGGADRSRDTTRSWASGHHTRVERSPIIMAHANRYGTRYIRSPSSQNGDEPNLFNILVRKKKTRKHQASKRPKHRRARFSF